MTTKTNTAMKTQADAAYETSQFVLGVGIGSAALLGVWACACMASAILNNGIGEVARGLIGAIVGS